MPVQPQLFPYPEPGREPSTEQPPGAKPPEPQRGSPAEHGRAGAGTGAPIWLQRMSLFVLVLFCVYLGVLVMVLPWWPRMWDQNLFLEARPELFRILHLGPVRGIISGLGALDIWIGISEAIHYREAR